MTDPLLRTHYEILGVQQSCTLKEIRHAFVQLSKEAHPDLNPRQNDSHAKFIRITEAYNVLSKPYLRQQYDTTLLYARYQPVSNNGFTVETNAPSNRTAQGFRDETLWEFRDCSRDKFHKAKPFYGIKGVKKVSNGAIAAGCIVFMLVGACGHFFAVKTSSAKAIEGLTKRDQNNSSMHTVARERAVTHGNEAQLERLRKEWDVSNN